MRGQRLQLELDHLRATWRQQVVVVLAGTAWFGVIASLLQSGMQPVVTGVLAFVGLVALLVTCSARGLAAVPGRLPASFARAVLCMLPIAFVVVLTLLAMAVHPLLGFLFVPVTILIAPVGVAGLVLAVTTAASASDEASVDPVPRALLALVARVHWRFVAAAFAAVVAVPFVLVPLVLTGVLLATIGPVASVGYGFAAAASVPWIALAARWACSATGLDDPAGTRTGVSGDPMEPTLAADTAWHRLHAWRGVCDHATPSGDWIDLAAASTLGLRVTREGSGPMRLLGFGADGVWHELGTSHASHEVVAVQLAAGRSFVQVQPLAAGAPSDVVLVELLVPMGAAAAA